MLTILVAFHLQDYRNFKDYYLKHVCVYWRAAFPDKVSYTRFMEWMLSVLLHLCIYLNHCFGICTGISFIDATSLKVCHNRWLNRHHVFTNKAARGKTSIDWFFGFKLHLVVNELGELLNITLTPGNTDDRQPVPELLEGLFGQIFADWGYVSQALAHQLFEAYSIGKPKQAQYEKPLNALDR